MYHPAANAYRYRLFAAPPIKLSATWLVHVGIVQKNDCPYTYEIQRFAFDSALRTPHS